MLKKALLLCGFIAAASLIPAAAQAYDLDNGRVKSSNCTQCHATNGQPAPAGYTSLVGRSYNYIYSRLTRSALKFNANSKTCRTKNTNDCLMAIHAQPYSTQDRQDIAYYLSRR